MTALAALGVNHLSAPISLRNQLALGEDRLPEALQALREKQGVQGAVLLSTCNRTEMYLELSQDSPQVSADIVQWYLQSKGLSAANAQHFYTRQDQSAVRHLFRVATGLDSQVLGEPQILGQLKAAYANAKAHHALAPNLDRWIQQSFAVAKDVRTSTGLGAHTVSVASTAVKLMKQLFDQLESRVVLVLGAGDTAELLCRHLFVLGVRRVVILNRNVSRAQRLADQLNSARQNGGTIAQAGALGDLVLHLKDADALMSATAAHEPVVRATQLQESVRARKRRVLLMVDLGLPSDIESACGKFDDCYLYGVDDLKDIADEGLQARQTAAVAAEAQIETEVSDFMRWLQSRTRIDPMLSLRELAHRQRDTELSAALQALKAGGDARQLLEKLAHQLTNQWLHAPTVALKSAAQHDDQALIDAARTLFRLPH